MALTAEKMSDAHSLNVALRINPLKLNAGVGPTDGRNQIVVRGLIAGAGIN
ncbi:MAG: hypothetical protein ACE5D2_07680 [Fidelibacterota bacterium]